jgi:L-fucose mutarotase/ribose pyranase (RbsD/FucU family)
MALTILHQTAKTHENEQFRRVVRIIDVVFKEHGFDGILVGNPFNENYRRFRADAILFYNHGVVIIDFKDYSGQLILPRGDDEFKSYPWYAEKASDHQAIEVKAGAHFLNPFLQLASYRNAFREIVEHNLILKQKINPSRVCIANIFSGPLELTNKVPGKYPYYKIAQESEIGALLYDLNNDNAYDEDIEKAVRSIFPADEYVQEYTIETEIIHKKDIIVGEEAKSSIDTFMQAEGNDILVLTSMDAYERDNWAKYLFSVADNYEIPEVQGLCHSNRISRRLRSRGIEAISLYSFIYGGNETTDSNQEEEDKDDWALQVIPLRSDSGLDDRALLIVYDAHLVSRSLSQTDLLRFGSGRLLEDFITFADPSSKRKVVFIGDPYMLSFGSSDDSAVNIANLKDICGDRVIHYYHQQVIDSRDSCKEALKCSLAQSMDAQLFNKLSYSFDDGSIEEIEKDEIVEKMKEWFSSPFLQEPQKAVLFFKKGDCLKTNLWIKNHCLNNGKDLAPGDLIIANNNIFIPDETGFGNPKRILNGMYFTVKEIREHISEEIPIKGFLRPVLLSFTKIAVTCLSLSGQSAEIWVLDNYLSSIDELAKEEQIAVNVFIERRIVELKKNSPFTDSEYYRQLMEDSGYQALSEEEKSAIGSLIHNRIVKKEEREQVTTTRTVR